MRKFSLPLTLRVLCAASLLCGAPAWAETDAGSLPDATTAVTDGGPTDGGSSDAGTTDVSTDAVSPPDATTGTTGFTPIACWNEKCVKEIDACKGNKVCVAIAECVAKGGVANTCAQEAKASQGDYDVYNAIQVCGWKSCNDPNAGSCGAPGKSGAANRCGQWDNSWKCNCDDACVQMGDCCADKDKVCAGGGSPDSCQGKCGKYDKNAKCQCDSGCLKEGDCCADYEKLCSGTSTGETCKDRCDDAYDQAKPCQCDAECKDNNDCCPDYSELCEACKPKCDGKECGSNGCGGKCGTCAEGKACDAAAGKCVVKGTESDAGSGGTDGGTFGNDGTGGTGGADVATGGDGTSGASDGTSGASDGTGGTGADGTGGTGGGLTDTGGGYVPPPASSSSGCTASPRGQGLSGLLALFAVLGAMWLVRRRKAA